MIAIFKTVMWIVI